MKSVFVAFAILALPACNASEALNGGNGNRDSPDLEPGPTHAYVVNEIVEGLEHPWAMAFLPTGDILVTERAGRVRLVRDGELVEEAVEGAPSVEATGQGGMLDIVLHPDFDSNGFVYISYSKAVQGGLTTAVARARWENDRLEGLEDVFVADAAASAGQHFGSRIVFDPDGMMYVTVGERGQQEPAQNLTDHIGTTVRLHDDGRAPSDNPFVDREDALDEIFTFGNRNAQGMAVHPETGEIWQNEHGPRGGDEINRMVAGGNYGWPDYSFGDHYDGQPISDPEPNSGIELPLLHWTPSIAPSGMAFYTGDRFPEWRGHVFNGALAHEHLRRVAFEGTEPVHEEELLVEYGERIRDVRDGPDGYLYFLTDSDDAVLARLEPDDG